MIGMSNKEHLAILEQGAEAWNKWIGENPGIKADFRGAYLKLACISGADLSGADLCTADLGGADLIATNLNHADLSSVDLRGADLSGANLSKAKLVYVDLSQANLGNANLSSVKLEGADLSKTNLIGADLSGGELNRVNLNYASLSDADFTNAKIGWIVFANVDLSDVKGLNAVRHFGPSTIGIDTLYKSGGNIPESFLRGCGVPDTFIAFARSLVNAGIDFYSCFISYSSENQPFAERLHSDLQSKGVRCWFAPEDLKLGEKIRVAIDESIRLHDKLLLVLSKHSVQSQWVEKEVETAMEQERKQKRTVLFPVMIDNSVMKIESGWPADIRRSRNIGDFCKWKNNDAYQKAFDRLLRDLKVEEVK